METNTRQTEDQFSAALQGGLCGRLAGAICVLQSSVEALQRYLAANTSPEVQRTAGEILAGMERRLAEVERLSAYAAQMALGRFDAAAQPGRPVELRGALRDFCDAVRQELALRGCAAELCFEDHTKAPFLWVSGEEGAIYTILVNLISNSVQAAQGAVCRIVLEEGGSVLYADNAGGTDPARALRLLDGRPRPEELAEGALGLLLAGDRARAMGWALALQEQPGGFALRLQPKPMPGEMPVAESPAAAQRRRQELLQAVARRELDGCRRG